MNNNKHIQTLIDKYFAGESNLSEEKILREYFNGENISPAVEEYTGIFQYFSNAKKESLPDSFDAKVLGEIERLESNTLQVTHRSVKTSHLRLAVKYISRVAAVLLIGLSIWWMYPAEPNKPIIVATDWSKYEVKTAEEAFKVTQLALTKVSYEMNSGASMVASNISRTRVNWKLILK